MKRSYLKRSQKPLKRSRLGKVSKQPISRLQREIWALARELVYRRDKTKNNEIFCYTCFQGPLEGSNRQLGHGPWPKSVLGAFLKYDLRVLKYQCYGCNINKGGMGYEFAKRLSEELGVNGFKQLEADRQKTVKAYDHYLKIREEYTELLNSGKHPFNLKK